MQTSDSDSYLLEDQDQYQDRSVIYETANGDGHNGDNGHGGTGNILTITDPSGAKIYLNGDLQSQTTSSLLEDIQTGDYTIIFTKAGYESYTEDIEVKSNKTTKVCAILTKLMDITGESIVKCTTTDILTCPTSPEWCSPYISDSDYMNMLAIIESTITESITIRFTYSIDGTVYNDDINASLISGTNMIYAWPTNRTYPPNTEIILMNTSLVTP